MKVFGILGGMGPKATMLLMNKVFELVQAEDDKDHIPLIVHQNTQVPSRIKAIIDGTGKSPLPVLKKMAHDLQIVGSDFLAMPCNTAHYYFDDIQSGVEIPILNMIEITIDTLKRRKFKKIGLLASPAVERMAVFEPHFENKQLTAQYADEEIMLDLIKQIKKDNFNIDLENTFLSECQNLIDEGCDGLLIACTELSLVSSILPAEMNWVDSLDCLSRSIVSTAKISEY